MRDSNAVAPGPTGTDLFYKGKSQELVDRIAGQLGEWADIEGEWRHDGGELKKSRAREEKSLLGEML
jgi:hypothetical protein